MLLFCSWKYFLYYWYFHFYLFIFCIGVNVINWKTMAGKGLIILVLYIMQVVVWSSHARPGMWWSELTHWSLHSSTKLNSMDKYLFVSIFASLLACVSIYPYTRWSIGECPWWPLNFRNIFFSTFHHHTFKDISVGSCTINVYFDDITHETLTNFSALFYSRHNTSATEDRWTNLFSVCV